MLCVSCGVVVDVWDSYVGYCGVVIGVWDSYVGYCGLVVGAWDSYVGYCGVVASGCRPMWVRRRSRPMLVTVL